MLQEKGNNLTDAPVVVAPGEELGDQLLGLEALHELDDLQVGHALHLGVLRQVVVLLREKDSLCTSDTGA